MDIQIKAGDHFTTFIIAGHLNATAAPEIETALNGAIDAGALHLVLNLAGMDYISSAGLRVLLAVYKRLARQKGTLVLCNLQPCVRDILQISGLLTIFVVAGTEAEAQSCAAP